MKKIAFITGITGMDGSHLADLLLEKGYEVHGLIRRSSNFNTKRIDHIFQQIHLHYGDMTDAMSLSKLINSIEPNEIYNFAAMSHVKVSFEQPHYTFETNTLGLLNLISIVHELINRTGKQVKVYHASTSEMFGNNTDGKNLLDLSVPLTPVSPYGISKLASHMICKMYRDAYHMFIVSSVLFNHESERRGETFITQKIARYVKQYSVSSPPLIVGNLDAQRDWGYAVDYVNGIFLMLQQEKPKDYILATGEMHSVREFIEIAFDHVGFKITWKKNDVEEEGWIGNNRVVITSAKYYRPIDIDMLVGDASQAKIDLKWKPTKTFKELVYWMVDRSGL